MMKKLLSVALASTLVMGCQTIDPYTGEQKTAKATTGAGIGAVAGALIGAATSSKSDRTKGVLTGAAVGGAIGGGVGYYMDQQEALLRQELEGTGVRVERRGEDIRLIMPGNITFATGSAAIESGFYSVLDSVSKVLMKFDRTQLAVDGFTDDRGSFEFNQNLSEQRARSVAQYLQGQGISGARIVAQGYGERYPVASNGTAEGRAMNRRVELNIRGNM